MTTPLLEDPLAQFKIWYEQAAHEEVSHDAMSLATVNEGRPDIRMVLYKGISKGGFLFYTNYNSAKGRALAQHPAAALCFYWPVAYRQVRITGLVERLTSDESHQYFQTRPEGSKISAWASEQSEVIPDRQYLLNRYAAYQQQVTEFKGVVECPPFWGGYRLIPDRIEFWLGGQDRLNERFLYQKIDDMWSRYLLAP